MGIVVASLGVLGLGMVCWFTRNPWIIAAMAIGATRPKPAVWIFLPLALIAVGLVASLAGIFSMHVLKRVNPQSALRHATYISGLFFLAFTYAVVRRLMPDLSTFWIVLSGLLSGILIGLESEFFTSGPPIRTVARSSQSGAATMIITGLATGFESTILPIATLVACMAVAYHFGGLYGIAIAAVGMLSTIGIVMSTDSYGPIADNAGGIAEMSACGPEIRRITNKLDALGNTTAAIGKGFAIGSAALTALALFSRVSAHRRIGTDRLDQYSDRDGPLPRFADAVCDRGPDAEGGRSVGTRRKLPGVARKSCGPARCSAMAGMPSECICSRAARSSRPKRCCAARFG